MNSKKIKLEILMGLPGSGKTTFAQEKNKHGVCVVDLDKTKERLCYRKNLTLSSAVREGVSLSGCSYFDCILVDGLLLTQDDVVEVISGLRACYNISSITIHRWNEDRETCLKNDGGRREVKSATTILHAQYDDIDVEKLREQLGGYAEAISVKRHTVQLKEDWYRFFKGVIGYVDDGKLRSEKWCTGGSYGSCWSNTLSPVSGEEPLEFDALDNLLEEIAPNITFLHYKKLRNECVKTEESYDRDYYGGGTHYLNWVCDLQQLYETLQSLGYSVQCQ